MDEHKDLFGHPVGPAQHSLFGDAPDRLKAPPVRLTPDPAEVRAELHAVLAAARAARVMPWPEREARFWQTVFPNMANWLPDDEAHQLRLAFASELARLEAA